MKRSDEKIFLLKHITIIYYLHATILLTDELSQNIKGNFFPIFQIFYFNNFY